MGIIGLGCGPFDRSESLPKEWQDYGPRTQLLAMGCEQASWLWKLHGPMPAAEIPRRVSQWKPDAALECMKASIVEQAVSERTLTRTYYG